MMTIADLIKSVIDSSKERIKTPIVGAFICSFIVYNWRPILILMFSNASIEDKIIVINNEYCNKSAFWSPVIIALIYTVFIPFIMIVIDAILVYAKKQRIANIYVDKRNTLQEKIDMASKVLELKNAESGNKEKQELLDQIESLQISNQEMTITNQNTVVQLNQKLKEANEMNKAYQDLNKIDGSLTSRLERLESGILSEEEKRILLSFQIDEKDRIIIRSKDYPNSLINDLIAVGVLDQNSNSLKITSKGLKYLKNLQSSI
ncbi:hypothetical protein NJT12_03410 [Flavobacterium sp. AC]|uniref:Uncharacterized protein n=1 Tax=Flavobacterium azizsancarii TaxID=2961580 RepID=A0ABT4W7Z4_9FLAO|nr:hypothetical protein [Flavobacterium azizsancarii]MDA6068659.1 hypothetical protein [Flavobacterium azizsancarii]